MGELDAVLLEQLADARIDELADDELVSRPGHELHPDDHGAVFHHENALGFERFHELVADLGMLQQFLPELLDQLAHLLHIRVIGEAERQLHHHPVARIVGDLLDFAEGHRVERPEMVAQLHRADGDFLDRPLDRAEADIFTLAEGIVEQEEGARENIADQRLGAEADGEADNPGPGEERRDIDAKLGEDDHAADDDDDNQQEIAKERQQRCQTGGCVGAAFLAAFGLRRVQRALILELAVDGDLHRLIGEIAEEGDQQHLPEAVDEAAVHREVDPPEPVDPPDDRRRN